MAFLVADARALSAGQYDHLVVYGSTAIADGGGGFYMWDDAATNADDGGEWIKPDAVAVGSPGRWHRVWTSTEFTAFGRSLVSSSSAAAARTALELGTMATQAETSYVSVVATPTTGNFPVLTAGGELNNSTYSNASFATSAQGTLAGTALQPADVGTIAAQNANSVTITGGAISGITDLAIADGGTGAGTAADAFAALKQDASETATGVVELATAAEVVTGTDTTRAVTAAGVHARYQPIRSVVTESGTTHTNAASDHDKWIRFTNTGAKTFTISSGVAAANDIWAFFNAGATGNLSIASSGMTLTGNLVFAPLKGGFIFFTSSSAADVIGGSAT